jgi:hypothetical protein
MNVFVLTTGRSGSLTFSEACRHMTNFSTGHETRVGQLGDKRLAYPADHIEVDDRLSWLLGRLDKAYGDDAFYVHLKRNDLDTAASRMRRWNKPLMRAYRAGILWDVDPDVDRLDVARDLNHTVNSNIRFFLRDRPQQMTIEIETATDTFPRFWERIGAEGDLHAALAEFGRRHHQGTSQRTTPRPSQSSRSWRPWHYVKRLRPGRDR